MADELAIRLRGAVKRYGPITAVAGLDLDVPVGTCVGLLGPNGAGKSTTMRLLTAQATLPGGLRLLITEGYRPPATQRSIFDWYREDLRAKHPDWSDARLYAETSKFASPVEMAPHSTGGAIDLTLCTETGVELDMGTCVDATPEASDNACFTAALNISADARRNRRTLARALTGTGLVNYPTEWWHWSFGDRYWAFVTGTGKTRYGPVSIESLTVTP